MGWEGKLQDRCLRGSFITNFWGVSASAEHTSNMEETDDQDEDGDERNGLTAKKQ